MNLTSYPQDLYPFQNRRILIAGHDIHYVDEGSGDILLLCHPPVASSFMYRHLIQKLSPSFRCIAPDFPGFGLTPLGANYVPSIQAQGEIMESFIQKLNLKNIYVLVQEVGGHAALTALSKKPELVKGIVLTDTIIFPVSQYPRISKMLEIINSKYFNFLNERFNFLIRAFCRFGVRLRKMSREDRKTYTSIFGTDTERRLITQMLYQLKLEEGVLKNILNTFETVFNELPVLLIYGNHDPLTAMGIPQRIHKMLPHSMLFYIQGEAHFPHEGAPDEMSDIINRWVQELKSRGHP